MLGTLAQKLLEVEAPLIEAALADELRHGEDVVSDTIGDETCIFLKGLHAAERAIAERLIARSGRLALARHRLWSGVAVGRGQDGQDALGLQREAVRLVLSSSMS